MSSGQFPGSSKSVNVAHQSTPPSYPQASSSSAADSGSQRRTGGSGSFGAGNQSAPRNIQPRKNQHKRHRRPHLVDDDAIAETAAMTSTTSRKGQTSITHLMNFSLPPRPQHHRHHPSHPFHRPGRRNPTWGLGSGYHAIDKARYVHANYRFIVNPKNSYFAQAANADVHLDWEAVLQVLVSAETQSASCPICLSTPVAPRMAKCGHIFCLPCLIRFMHSTDDAHPIPEKKAKWKKCPICWDIIYISDTRPVRWFTGQEAGIAVEGGDIVLRLVTRQPGSTLALPRDGAESIGPHEDIPWYHVAEVSDYARIMKGGEDYMVSQYDAEISDLQVQEREDELMFGDDTTWSHRAVAAVNESKEKIRGIGNPSNVPRRQPVEPKPLRRPIDFESPPEGVPEMYTFQHAVKSGQSSSAGSMTPAHSAPVSGDTSTVKVDAENLSSAISDLEIEPAQSNVIEERGSKSAGLSSSSGKQIDTNGPHPPEHPFYFYQALPHFYLSSLDIRILKAAFGNYSHFPSTILPRIERISTGHIVDDDLRKRAKYLGHLPYGCEVSFLECDWTDLVGPDILAKFKTEIERRRKRNREKEAREDKERIRAEKEEEDKRWVAARRKRPSISSSPVEQPFSHNDFQPLSGNTHPNVEPNQFQLNDPSASPPRSSGFGVLASPSTSPSAPRTVWGTVIAPGTEPQQPTHQETNNARDDGWLQGWEKELDDSDVAAQMAAMGEGSSTPAGSGKKKKKKQITLMSTNARRGA